MARSNRIAILAVDPTTMPVEIKLSRRRIIAAGALEPNEVVRRHAQVDLIEAIFRLPYMSSQFPGFVVCLAPTRCARERHGCKMVSTGLEQEQVSNKPGEDVWMFDFGANVDVPF
jgi:hypothetical protein